MNQKTRRILVLACAIVVVVFSITALVVAMIPEDQSVAETALLDFEADSSSMLLSTQSSNSGSCKSFMGMKFCVRGVANKDGVKVGVKLPGVGYHDFVIVGNGCFNLNPTKILTNAKLCIKDYNRYVDGKYYRGSFRTEVRVCFSYFFGEKCKTVIKKNYNFSYPRY
jgi:hypothetical protein